jgi:hypothetical membrane protein
VVLIFLRPYKIRLSTIHLAIFVLPSITLCLVTIFWADGFVKVLAFMCMSVGPVTYGFLYYRRKKRNDAENTTRYHELQQILDENLTSKNSEK